jgi:hypothetical protein
MWKVSGYTKEGNQAGKFLKLISVIFFDVPGEN